MIRESPPGHLAGIVLVVLAPLLLSGCSREEPALAALEELRSVVRADYDTGEYDYEGIRSKYYPDYAAFAQRWRGTEAGLQAELWILQTIRNADLRQELSAPEVTDKLDAIFAEYGHSPHIYHMADSWYSLPSEELEERFDYLIEHSPDARVRAASMYALVDAGSRDNASAELAGRREALLNDLVRDYAEVPWNSTTFGEIAAAELNPHDPADLEVGDRAPEITGRNIDGEEMKLSDYLGNVVVLDFWGDW